MLQKSSAVYVYLPVFSGAASIVETLIRSPECIVAISKVGNLNILLINCIALNLSLCINSCVAAAAVVAIKYSKEVVYVGCCGLVEEEDGIEYNIPHKLNVKQKEEYSG